MNPTLCPNCNEILLPNTNFCPKCGFPISNKQQVVSIGKQIYQYIFSAILPPFGLVWAFKYLRTTNSQQRRVGWIIIILTAVSLMLSIWFVVAFFQNLSQQFSTYRNLGL